MDAKGIIDAAEEALSPAFRRVDEVAYVNQRRVLEAFRLHRLTEEFFAEKTGYGRNDPGRETIDAIFATIFGAQSAAVRMQLVSGTHAIAAGLFGCLKSGDRLVCLTGDPYDTLHDVIGIGDRREPGSLKSFNISYGQMFIDPSEYDEDELANALAGILEPPVRVAYIQKSRGYSFDRRTFANKDIAKLASVVKKVNPDCIVFVDNCYGEFVETSEPTACGADLVAGSLIKNPGGGLAIAGGYLAGRTELIQASLNRITAPGIGGHQGLTYNQNRLLLQGLFMAPATVANAVKGAMLFAHALESIGLTVSPTSADERFDIIQAIEFGSRDRLVAFCRAIQMWSPVNAHVTPEPATMPGYQDEVIMAGGTFVEGSTIELSADGPLRPPFAAFLQGGLTYQHVKCALHEALMLCAGGELRFT